MPSKHLFTRVPKRDPKMKDIDKSALYAIAQAAVNVELFTIPLYMTSLYSLQGTHQITGPNDFYLGRLWPGMSTTADPKTANDTAFNAIFSVFIAEMLHLQLASNICKAIGAVPSFTSPMLQNKKFGWTCYGPDNTVIPHIIDLLDTKAPYNQIKVSLGPVNKNQVDLFLAIEETEEDAEDIIVDPNKYFPEVPFDDYNWTVEKTEKDLPLFGSIGYMYLCLFKYLTIPYDDDTTLWDYVYKSNTPPQRDLFNVQTKTHDPEYPGMAAVIDAEDQDAALLQVIDMIQGITDQGEGKGVIPEIRNAALTLMKSQVKKTLLMNQVKLNFQPKPEALEKDYPTYNDKGEQKPKSRDAAARIKFGAIDHFETFSKVKELLDKGELFTWDQWHAKGNLWTAEMLQTPDHTKNKYPIPATGEIAGALNRLKENESNFEMLSQVVAGAIKGVTTVLNDYWSGKTPNFPFPSMAGSGDRMSLCWAVFGKTPDLSLGVTPKTAGILYHACQGMDLDPNNLGDANSCAAVEVYHTCKGSNTCAAEGGCGFVQSVKGGAGCGGTSCSTAAPAPTLRTTETKVDMIAARSAGHGYLSGESGCGHAAGKSAPVGGGGCGQHANKVLCGAPSSKVPTYYSAPSDNKCASYGGCAVPISASQIYPAPDENNNQGQMELFNYIGTDFQRFPINTMAYNSGDLVYDVAWNAYIAVLQARNRPIPAKPKPSDVRLAFPPST